MSSYYCIRVSVIKFIPGLHTLQEKNELCLSANGRLCAFGGEACLDSHDLAEEFLNAYNPRLRKRYGDHYEAEIVEATGNHHGIEKRIADDSALARKRIATGILASNRTP